MRKSILLACLSTAIAIAVFSCSKDKSVLTTTTNLGPVDVQQVRQDIQKALLEIQKVQGVDMQVETRMAAQFIVVPAGSNNVLIQALQDAGEGGIVYLRSGLHTEMAGIVISKRVILIGENGAVLKIKSVASQMNLSNGVTQINPAIHVLNAPQTAIQNVEIQPTDTDGSTAILYENSPLSATMYCTMKQFMFSVIVEKSNQMTIMGNKMTGSTTWQTNPGPQIGVLIINGKSAWIANNEAESSVIGIFMGDQYGSCVQNNTHNNVIGINLCHIAPNSLKMPDGRLTGAEVATNAWKVRNNQSNNNISLGYGIIDGSNDNTLEGNTATGNGDYDYELAGFTRRLGFPMPPSFNNKVTASAGQKVKDCGNNNLVSGGTMSSDPCIDTYPNDVATKWTRLQMEVARTTAGYSPGVTSRSYGYSGLTLYESIVSGVSNYQSVATQFGAPNPAAIYDASKTYYLPASANAAMATFMRNFFPTTSAANKFSIDSLEASFNTQFQGQATADELARSIDLGRKVSANLFEWSKTDGLHEAYLNLPSGYVPPVGPGLWQPTPPAFAAAALPFAGNDRSFLKDVAATLQIPAPPAYSENSQSPFYKMVEEVYNTSLSLTPADSVTVKFWGDLPGLYNAGNHFASVVTQLIENERFPLFQASTTYAKHGIALNDAICVVFKTKYTYNLVRPITYIRTVMGHPTWNTVIATPPHPEYSSAHAVTMKATAVVLESIFGSNYTFTDNTYRTLYGPRTYTSFSQYAEEGARSRVLGGIHYQLSADVGLQQGKKLGDLVNAIKFRK